MTRKRIQVSFAHAQPVTGVQKPGNLGLADAAVIIDVDLTGETFRSPRSRPRKPRPEGSGSGLDQLGLRGNPPVGGYKLRRRRLISIRADLHTICIFYRHVL
jgi:hypothetical protein